MANPEHLKILNQGVEQWNRWVDEHRDVRPDLSLANLGGANLGRANLYSAYLSGAHLSRANLGGAYLTGANLSGAYLTGANLSGADLSEASLTGANLGGANLSEANLSRANVGGADLRQANLYGANLSDADFSSADLRGAYLFAAHLSGANLSRADLNSADLRTADLSSAKLTEASLGGANFWRADLRETDLTGARAWSTIFADLDLSTTRGLETIQHHASSTVGIDTIYKSRGKIPKVFLRRCGVPKTFFAFMHSLMVSPIEFYSCFISYSTQDKEFAERIYGDLQQKNVRCWYAPEDLKIGDKFQERIEDSIRLHDKLLLVLSENSVSSIWVEREVQAAREREDRSGELVLFPIRIDAAVMDTTKAWAADLRRVRHIGDFTTWKEHDSYRKAFQRLLRDLNAERTADAAP